ncbi:MAG TPA: hypothetical protein VK449_00165 [Anaerolineales bacterium]|nr:hypothetical protein [Anaerolineales bacterium]
MSSAADLILAGPDDAPRILASEYPLGTFKGVSVDGLSPLELAALYSLLVHKAFDEALRECQPLGQASPQGPWLVRLPAELVESLLHISPQDQASMAARWASTDPTKSAGWTDEQADSFLGRLVPFAQSAAFEGKALFLWIYD